MGIVSFRQSKLPLKICLLSICFGFANAMGTLPDASQEGLVREYDGYATLAVFHYTVPPEISRATWEFASFQDRESCPRRRVSVHLRRGSFPVVSPDNSTIPDFFFHTEEDEGTHIKILSEYQPADSSVLPVYNPLPGSWIAVAYLHKEDEHKKLSWLEWIKRKIDIKKCRYSVGSIALWSRLDSVDLILPSPPTSPQTFYTSRRFHYYKLHVPQGVDAFRLQISNCTQLVKPAEQNGTTERTVDNCLDYLGLRARALPFHLPKDFDFSVADHGADETERRFDLVAEVGTAVFIEERPYQGQDYYLLVASRGEVSFQVSLSFLDCGDIGLYGRQQSEWYMTERGLEWSKDYSSKNQPKEPKSGFQLFSVKAPVIKDIYKPLFGEDGLSNHFQTSNNHKDKDDISRKDLEFSAFTSPRLCHATFDFTRVTGVAEFASNFLLQGRSWYTKWLTVLEQGPVVTRFQTLDFIDSGGFVNINLMMDRKMWSFKTKEEEEEEEEVYQIIRGCLSYGRAPPFNLTSCKRNWTMEVSDKTPPSSLSTLRVLPYPSSGTWHLSFQVSCHRRRDDQRQPCPGGQRRAMVSVGLHIQPCGYRPTSSLCGDHGVCAKATKGQLRVSACTCFDGHRGITCDDSSQAVSKSASALSTLLLTLSNLAFLPAAIIAAYYGLYGEALVYFSTMLSSTFYHTCDQEALTMKLPLALERVCMSFYVNKEVLQFCDFYCAILSFWVTIVALAMNLSSFSLAGVKIGAVKNLLDLSGAILVAILVQYNRTGVAVLLLPLCLGLILVLVSLVLRYLRKRRLPRPSRSCLVLVLPAGAMAVAGLGLTVLAGAEGIYPYTHSLWHILMAAALLCLLPQCRPRRRRKAKLSCSHHNHHQQHPDKCHSSIEMIRGGGGNLNPQMEERNGSRDEEMDASPTTSSNYLSNSDDAETEIEMTEDSLKKETTDGKVCKN